MAIFGCGHERTPANIQPHKNGDRCKTCHRAQSKKWAREHRPIGRAALHEAVKDVTVHLIAAVSLLEKAYAEKKRPNMVVGSDAMFEQMLADYRKAIARGRKVTYEEKETP